MNRLLGDSVLFFEITKVRLLELLLLILIFRVLILIFRVPAIAAEVMAIITTIELA